MKKEAKVVKLQEAFSDLPADSLMLVATPKLVDDYMKQVPKGHHVDMKTLRKDMASDFHADNSSSVIAPGSKMAARLTFGEDFLKEQLKAEMA